MPTRQTFRFGVRSVVTGGSGAVFNRLVSGVLHPAARTMCTFIPAGARIRPLWIGCENLRNIETGDFRVIRNSSPLPCCQNHSLSSDRSWMNHTKMSIGQVHWTAEVRNNTKAQEQLINMYKYVHDIIITSGAGSVLCVMLLYWLSG